MVIFLKALTFLYCQCRRLHIYAIWGGKAKNRGWYDYDVYDIRQMYDKSYFQQSKKYFSHEVYYEQDYHEICRRLRIGNYLIILSYYRVEGFRKILGMPERKKNIITLADYRNNVYTYDHLKVGELITKERLLQGGGNNENI